VSNWFKGLFSLEERKASTVMLTYIAFSGVGVYLLFKTGNIPSPLSYIIISLAGLIAGVNLAPAMMSMMGQSQYGGYNSYGSNYGGSYGNNYGSSNQYSNYSTTTPQSTSATTQSTTVNSAQASTQTNQINGNPV